MKVQAVNFVLRSATLAWIVAVTAPAQATGGGAEAAVAKRPNVLFLFTDDQRADTIAALGNRHIKTPNLDRLACGGFVFDNAYCMGSGRGAVCLPSRTMMITGMSLFHLNSRPKDTPNFPRSMNQAGYVTYHHGKRGNTPRAIHKEFDHTHYLEDHAVRTSGYPGKVAADDAIAFLKRHAAAGWREPLFMYLAFAGPHDPRTASEEYLAMYDVEQMSLPANYLPEHPFDNGELRVRDERLAPWPRTEAVVRSHLRDYYAVITHMDMQIGRVLTTLEELGQYDRMIIIFSSDHGLAVGSHGLMGKQNLYEHSMRSPLIVTGPGIRPGRSEAFAYLFDIYPTVCELVGAEVPSGIDGKSLAPILRGRSGSVRETVFTAYKDVQRAVRHGRWKLLRYPQVDQTQLFDLHADPAETRNLAGDPARAAKVKEMLTLLRTQQRVHDDTLSPSSK